MQKDLHAQLHNLNESAAKQIRINRGSLSWKPCPNSIYSSKCVLYIPSMYLPWHLCLFSQKSSRFLCCFGGQFVIPYVELKNERQRSQRKFFCMQPATIKFSWSKNGGISCLNAITPLTFRCQILTVKLNTIVTCNPTTLITCRAFFVFLWRILWHLHCTSKDEHSFPVKK